MSATGYKRVYTKGGRYYFVDTAGKWHKLTRVDDGEPAMLRALARIRDKPEARPGSMPRLVEDWRRDELPNYAESTRKDYGRMLDHIAAAMRDRDVAEVDSEDVLDLRDQWLDKPRTANVYQSLLSLLMGYAIKRRQRKTNPCADVKKLREKPRTRSLSHEEMRFIIQGLCVTGRDRPIPSGPMMSLVVIFAYLTGLRMIDIRTLPLSAVGDKVGDVIRVTPSKTAHSTGITLEIVITEDILDVIRRAKAIGTVKGMTLFHGLKGRPYSKDAIETAWQRACARQDIKDAHFHDLRSRALSDAKRRGVALSDIQDAAGHSSVTTTEDYLRGMDVKRVNLGLKGF